MIRWKSTVRFDKLHSAMLLAALRIDEAYCRPRFFDCWISSANDSKHKPHSKHYSGRALDFRTKNFPKEWNKKTLEADIRKALGSQFFVQMEDIGGPNEHLHVQFNGE